MRGSCGCDAIMAGELAAEAGEVATGVLDADRVGGVSGRSTRTQSSDRPSADCLLVRGGLMDEAATGPECWCRCSWWWWWWWWWCGCGCAVPGVRVLLLSSSSS